MLCEHYNSIGDLEGGGFWPDDSAAQANAEFRLEKIEDAIPASFDIESEIEYRKAMEFA